MSFFATLSTLTTRNGVIATLTPAQENVLRV
jgi:hypothetical protein